MTFVLDASVALSWCFEDEKSAYASTVLESLRSGEAFAASIWPLEVANGLLVAERRGRIPAADATRAGRLLLALPIAVDPVERSRALGETRRVARARGLSVYDAAYLELALRLGLPLATLDGELQRAAAEENVERFAPA